MFYLLEREDRKNPPVAVHSCFPIWIANFLMTFLLAVCSNEEAIIVQNHTQDAVFITGILYVVDRFIQLEREDCWKKIIKYKCNSSQQSGYLNSHLFKYDYPLMYTVHMNLF